MIVVYLWLIREYNVLFKKKRIQCEKVSHLAVFVDISKLVNLVNC